MLPYGFKSAEFADVTLKIVARREHRAQAAPAVQPALDQELPADGADTADRRVRPRLASTGDDSGRTDAPELPAFSVLSEFPAHRLVLAAKSSWFRTRLNAVWQNNTDWQHNNQARVLELQLEEEDLAAFEVMVQHMYEATSSEKPSTDSISVIPDCMSNLSQSTLVKLFALCDYYNYAPCAVNAAFVLQQAGAADLSWEAVHMVYSAPEDITKQPHMHGLYNLATEKLRLVFIDLEATARDAELRQVWINLPPQAIAAVLSSDEIQVVSEDTVMYVLAAWMRNQKVKPTRHVRDMLYKLVRVPQLTAAGLEYLMPLCPGFFQVFTSTNGPQLLAAIKSPPFVHQPQSSSSCSTLFQARPVPSQASARLTVSLTKADLQRAEQQLGPPWKWGVNIFMSEPLLMAGFFWCLEVRFSTRSLLLRLTCVAPLRSTQAQLSDLPARTTFMKPTQCTIVHGLPDPVSAPKYARQGERDSMCWLFKCLSGSWQQYLIEDKLVLHAEVKGPVKCDDTPFELLTRA